jgi:hypothetical protein
MEMMERLICFVSKLYDFFGEGSGLSLLTFVNVARLTDACSNKPPVDPVPTNIGPVSAVLCRKPTIRSRRNS